MIALMLLLWLAGGVAFVWVVRKLRSEFDSFDEPIEPHGPTRIIELDNGRKLYVGRAYGRPWIQMPGLETALTPEEAIEIRAALEDAIHDALCFR